MTVLLVVVVGLAVTAVARRLRLSAPLLLVAAGLACALLPAFPDVTINPDVVLYVMLPPLLYSAALNASYVDIRANLRPILVLSVGLVLFTTVVVGLTANALIPALGLPLALALGAVVAPPDAVAATAVGRTLGLPRRLLTILGGESLLNDATALTAYSVAVAAAVGGHETVANGVRTFAVAAVGGVAIGLAGGFAVHGLLRRLRDPVLENAVSLVLPFVLFGLAQQVHASGVLAVVVAGLVIGERAPRTLSYATRLQADSVWQVVDLVLEAVVFLLIGLQLSTVVDGMHGTSAGQLALWSVVILLVVVLSRFVWVFPGAYLARLLPSVPEPAQGWRAVVVLGWCGMRGVVSLAAAFALPLTTEDGGPLQGRNLVVFLTFVVVVGTLVLQGLTLPWVIRRLHVTGPPESADRLDEAEATNRAVRAGVDRLDALLEQEDEVPDEVVQALRDRARRRANGAWERLGSARAETPSATYRRLRLEMLAAERQVLVEMRDRRELDDELLRRAQRDLDIEEASLSRD